LVVCALVLVGLGVLGTPQVANAAPTARADHLAAPSGRVAVTIRTPAGVPANVTLRGRTPHILAKSAAGTDRVVRRTLPIGRYRVQLPPIDVRGVLYIGHAPETIVIRSGHSARLTATYQRSQSASNLRIVGISRSTITVAWTAPKRSTVMLRRTVGSIAPASVRAGVRVRARGQRAADTGLKPGHSYSYALFSRTGGRWVGPLTLLAGTVAPTTSRTASFVTTPGTMLAEPNQIAAAAGTGSGLTVEFTPGTTPPVIGSIVALPKSTALRGGYIGRVLALSADGVTAALAPASLSDAFAYYSVDVSHFQSSAVPLTPVASPATGARARPRGSSCLRGSLGESLTYSPTLSIGGSFGAHINTLPFLHVPTGASLDVSLWADVGGDLSIKTTGTVSCQLSFGSVTQTITEAPIPIAYQFSPSVSIGVSGQLAASNLGGSVRAGVQITGSFGATHGASFSGSPILRGQADVPTGTISSTVGLKLGGQLLVGPGEATSDAGVIAGVSGQLYPLDASIGPQFVDEGDGVAACIRTSIGMTTQIGLTAKAWLGSWSVSKTLVLSTLGGPYYYLGSPWYTPENCQSGGLGVPDQTLAPGGTDIDYTGSVQASGGTAPYSWSITDGEPPPGLTLDPTGVLSGTPTVAGTYQFTVEVVDALGRTASGQITINVDGSDGIPGTWTGTIHIGGTAIDTCPAAYTDCNTGFLETRTTDVTISLPHVPGDAAGDIWNYDNGDGNGLSDTSIVGYHYKMIVTSPDGREPPYDETPCNYEGSDTSTITSAPISTTLGLNKLYFGQGPADFEATVQQEDIQSNDDVCTLTISPPLGDTVIYGGLAVCIDNSDYPFRYDLDQASLLKTVPVNGTPTLVMQGDVSSPCTETGSSGAVTISFDLAYTPNPDYVP
jgi:Putative Ig domain